MPDQIKSRERVRNRGEVFTADREVNAMLDLIPAAQYENPLSTWLEPACGNGNFLVAILSRKIAYCPQSEPQDIYALKVISSLYGIDIDTGNVHEAIQRLYDWLAKNIQTDNQEHFLDEALEILHCNIRIGDFINRADTIILTEFIWKADNSYILRPIALSDVIKASS